MKYATLRVVLRVLAAEVLLVLVAMLAFGYLGWLHPAFDSFSHFRLHLAAALALGVPILLLFRFRPEAIFASALATLMTLQTVGLPFTSTLAARGEGNEAVYRLLHMNLRFDNAAPEDTLSLIGRLRPDVLTLNEVSVLWRQKLSLIEDAYPYRIICPSPTAIGGAAILSRRPFAQGFEPYCGDRGAFVHARLDIGGRVFDVAGVHLGWPWPFAQPWQLPNLAPLLGQIGDTAIVAGDLNAVPWSQTARRVSADAGARILRGIGPTWLDRRLPDWLRPLIGLPIDNLMVKGGVAPVGLGTTERTGSDHLPVLLEFRLLPQDEPGEALQTAVASRAVGQ